MATSKVIQPINLVFQRNCVEMSIAYIFVNTLVHHVGDALPYKNAQQHGDIANQLFSNVLKF